MGIVRCGRRLPTGALTNLPPGSPNWATPVLTMSAAESRGFGALWGKIVEHIVEHIMDHIMEHVMEHGERMEASGAFPARRSEHSLAAMGEPVEMMGLARPSVGGSA